MKAMTNFLKLSTVVVLSIFIFSCEGEDGAVGPAGAQGEQGQQGEQGETGTANVIYSDWITVFPDPTIILPIGTFDAPGLTQEIRDTGVVLVYGQSELTGTGTVTAIPSESGGQIYTTNIGASSITIIVEKPASESVFLPRARYVIIPGGVAADKNAAGIDYTKMSYEEIKALFDIPE